MLKRLSIILLVLVITIGYALYKKNSLESQLAGGTEEILKKVPAATLTDLEGKEMTLHGLFKEQSVGLLVVHFWGTWCGPCEAELPELLTFIKRFEGRSDVKFLLVAVNDDPVKVKKHIARLPPTLATWLLDQKDQYRDLFGTTKVPETYVFAGDMTTLRKFVGPQEWNKDMFVQTFNELAEISTRKL